MEQFEEEAKRQEEEQKAKAQKLRDSILESAKKAEKEPDRKVSYKEFYGRDLNDWPTRISFREIQEACEDEDGERDEEKYLKLLNKHFRPIRLPLVLEEKRNRQTNHLISERVTAFLPLFGLYKIQLPVKSIGVPEFRRYALQHDIKDYVKEISAEAFCRFFVGTKDDRTYFGYEVYLPNTLRPDNAIVGFFTEAQKEDLLLAYSKNRIKDLTFYRVFKGGEIDEASFKLADTSEDDEI